MRSTPHQLHGGSGGGGGGGGVTPMLTRHIYPQDVRDAR